MVWKDQAQKGRLGEEPGLKCIRRKPVHLSSTSVEDWFKKWETLPTFHEQH